MNDRDLMKQLVGLLTNEPELLVLAGGLLLLLLAWRWLHRHRTALLARSARWRWLFARLTPGEYLGLHLTLGLLISAGCLWLFGDLAEDIVTRDSVVLLDQQVASSLHAQATPTMTTWMILITDLGTPAITALAVGLTIVFVLRRRWVHACFWLAAVLGGSLLNVLLKNVFARPRPSFEHPLLIASNYSFPSGHAMGSLIAYGMLAYFAWLLWPTRWRRALVISGASVLVGAIGFSRIYLGVHYLSDVIAGFAAGGVWLSSCITGMELVRRGEVGQRWRRSIKPTAKTIRPEAANSWQHKTDG